MDLKDGIYICKINKVEYKISKSNKEMVTVEFEVTDEECECVGQKMYMNQFVNTDFGKKLAIEFFKSLQTTLDLNGLTFAEDKETLEEFGNQIVENTKLMEFDVQQTTKGPFKSYRIVGIYDLVKE